MPRWLRITGAVAAGFLVLLILAGAAIWLLAGSGWGRELARERAGAALTDLMEGRVEIGAVEGNLITGATLRDVVIEGEGGGAFLTVDAATIRLALLPLLRRHIVIRSLHLEAPVVVLDQPPGGEWNAVRIFRRDPGPALASDPDRAQSGFGSTVILRNVTVEGGQLTVRLPWSPSQALEGEARAAVVAEALSENARQRVVEVEGGWQQVMEFRQVEAHFPEMLLARPGTDTQLFDLASARMTALPFRPPGLQVEALSGRIHLAGDSLGMETLRVALPGSSLEGEVHYNLDTGAIQADLEIPDLSLSDLRWLRPDLPAGHASGRVELAGDGIRTEISARDLDVVVEEARVSGSFAAAFGPFLEVGEGAITFSGVETRLLNTLLGDEVRPFPVEGSMRGALELVEAPEALQVEGWTEFVEPSGGVSRLELQGGLGTTREGTLRAQGLRVRMEPIRASLLRQLSSDIPGGGEFSGSATVTGPLDGPLDVVAELVHRDPVAGISRILAEGEVDAAATALRDLQLRLAPVQLALLRETAPELPVGGTLEGTARVSGSPEAGFSTWVDLTHRDTTGVTRIRGPASWTSGEAATALQVELEVPRLALNTVGRFLPAAGLAGTASGSIVASGTLERPTFSMELVASDSGAIRLEGSLDRRGAELGYDTRMVLRDLDAATLSTVAPTTGLSGFVGIGGTGLEPATARLALEAELVDTHWDSIPAEPSRIRATVGDGVVTVQQFFLSLRSATLDLEGTFGVVGTRAGELRYTLEVDSLSAFRSLAPPDSTIVAPRPLPQARRLARARADSMRIAEATEVQRRATGHPPPPALVLESPPPLSRDDLSGTVRAEGVLSGNVERLRLEGTAEAEDLRAAGVTGERIRARYTLVDFPTPDADGQVEVEAQAITAQGFVFDSIIGHIMYRGVRNQGVGELELGLYQDPERDYHVAAGFLLEVDRRELTFADLLMHFDTVTWTSTGPASLRFAQGGVAVDSLELVTPVGPGRLFLDGILPGTDPVDLRVVVEQLPLSQVTTLLQDTSSATGWLGLDAHLGGTRARPQMEGTATLRDATLGGRPLPDLDATFAYVDRELQTTATLQGGGLVLMTADATLPVNLALQEVAGSRLLEEPMAMTIHADSLPLESLPSFTDAVEDVRGRVRADLAVSGTPSSPQIDGTLDLDLASFRIVPAGISFTELTGATRFTGNRLLVDTLHAVSGGGPIAVTGQVDLAPLTQPSFDLALTAQRALVLDNERGRVKGDADLAITGPLDAPRVEGTVRVREAVIRVPEVGETRRSTALDAPEILAAIDTNGVAEGLLPEPNPFLENLRLDMALRIDRNSWVRNSEANIEVYTPEAAEPLRIRMNLDEPGLQLEGVMNADRGEYIFSGRVFALSTGSAVFLPGGTLDPLLQLSANYEVARPGREALTIQIHVGGTLLEPRVTLESSAEPPLSESDLLSYLAFGKSSSSLLAAGGPGLTGGGGGGIGTLAQQQLATLAIGALLDEVVADVEREGNRVGLDIFRISPADLPAELAFSGQLGNFLRGTEVVAGRYFGSRLFVGAQGRTTTEAWPGLRAEYRAPGGFTWETTWEPRFLPGEPTLEVDQVFRSTRALGSFLFWRRRF